MNTLISPATVEHAEAILPLMDAEDSLRVDPGGLTVVLRVSSISWCAKHDEQPMCIGGVTEIGGAWMISTPELHRQKRFFLRQSKTVMKLIADQFSGVSVTVDPCYFRSVRWLLWLGFKMDGDGRFPLNGELVPVQRFKWVRP